MSPINYDEYPDNWKDLSERIRWGRAYGGCECNGECGRQHEYGYCYAIDGQSHPETGSTVILTVAHLCGDDCSEANAHGKCAEPSHLRAMCQACHLSLDGDRHARKAAETRRRQQIEAGQQVLWEWEG